ncbi:MAG TPA: hypothetical protein VIH21_07130 [Dehalococcoidia bacterium]
MKVNLRGQHDLGEIVGFAYRIYSANFAPLFVIAAITAPMQMLIAIADRQIDNRDVADTVVGLLQVPAALITVVAVAALISAVHNITAGEKAEPGQSLDVGLARFWDLLTSGLLAGVLTFAAALAFPFLAIYWLIDRDASIDGRRDWRLVLIPLALLFYLSIRWAFVAQAVVIERKKRWPALDASADTVRGYWWRTLGIIIVIALIQLGPISLATASALGPPLLEATVTAFVGALVLPFAVAAQILLYYDLKSRKQPDAISAAPITDP